MTPPNRRQFWLRPALFSVLALPLVAFGWQVAQRPPQTNQERPLFQGITYRREFRSTPRPVMLHIVTVDLKAPGLQPLVTPGEQRSILWETNARTTSEFLAEFKLQLAVNASFFHPFAENTPWNYYPRPGDRVGVVGQAISSGKEYGPPLPDWPVLCFQPNQQAQILTTEQCPAGTTQAVAGSAVLVANGRSLPPRQTSADSDGLYSRTAIAIDRSGYKLWILAVDDKQWRYSEGVSLAELAELAIALGADAAINLDGGGSTTLVTATPNGPEVLNAPVHAKIPRLERPVANHLGFYAQPLPNR